MLTANPPWGPKGDTNSDEIITRIGELNESPLIVSTLSSEAKSFLKGCFSRKSMYRLTVEMLLAHPFLEGIDEDNEDDDDNNNNNNVEDTGDVFDINAISSLIMSEGEDDEAISFSLFSDDLCSWSEEEDVTSAASAPLNEVHHQYPITFTVV
ncbi:putative mitogen-activated protein kinase kinase kinase [Helianthus annuus]|uniref:Mitogen-activated protein kinase kinase kinase n=2 Tax=Helianthus annuus TaxID=4232 RepID=A0A251U0V1_HELAN|nr:putative mitogen-activated protein kinase kinase kinase [Helianthus annuus]KAJ0895366.1 putative mitogen-activated protein kinase kinase kinase [Helianthus annuus]